MIAKNAQPIIDARLRGKKPADMVIVSLVGPVGMENPTVFADPAQQYDWRWCRGLDVCVYLDVVWGRLRQTQMPWSGRYVV